jgi:hypothetical protein
MKTIDVTEITALVGKYLVDPHQEPVILTGKGKPLAVVLPVNGADVETISLSFHPKFLAIMERSRRRYDKEGGISHEEMLRLFGLEPKADVSPRARGSRLRARGAKSKADGRRRNAAKNGQG